MRRRDLSMPPAAGSALASQPRSWSLVVLPDTQVYSQHHPEIFLAQLSWVARAAEPLGIRFVAHVGDVTETNSAAEWRVARQAFDQLEGRVPYAIAAGNHDYATRTYRSSGLSRWFPPRAASPTLAGLFAPEDVANSFHTFAVDDEQVLVLTLEWGPRDAVLQWARGVLAAHPRHLAIIVTHAYLYNDNTRYDWEQRGAQQLWNPRAYAAGRQWAGAGELNDGQQIWTKLIDSFDNVKLVLCGHVIDPGVGRHTQVTSAGGAVHALLANFQGEPLGGGGYLRLLRFTDEEIEVRTYSPFLRDERLAPEHSFVLAR